MSFSPFAVSIIQGVCEVPSLAVSQSRLDAGLLLSVVVLGEFCVLDGSPFILFDLGVLLLVVLFVEHV